MNIISAHQVNHYLKGIELPIDNSNTRFYKAFESLSLERMEEVWKHSDNVVCVHPGWDLFTGWMSIYESWATIFRETERIQFHITNTKIKALENMAIVICFENIKTIVNENKIRMSVVATNIRAPAHTKRIWMANDTSSWFCSSKLYRSQRFCLIFDIKQESSYY